GPDRLRPALQQQDMPSLVDRPFDVLRAAIMVLNAAANRPQRLPLLVAERRRRAQIVGQFFIDNTALWCGHLADMLVRNVAYADLAGDLAHHPAVRRHFAGDNRAAEAPSTLYGDDGLVAGRRRAREHDAGGTRVD